MKIVIHAGRHKTGTTYLQRFLGTNAPALLKEFNVLYPEVGRHNAGYYHHEFFQQLSTNGDRKDLFLRELKREVAEANPEIVLFSSEYLSRDTVRDEELRAIVDALSPADLEVIVYLRKQDDFLCSRFAERVKRGHISYPDSIFSINAELDYETFLDRYAKAFGDGKLSVRSYDRAVESGLIKDFAACLQQPAIADLPVPSGGANRRLPWRYVQVLWYANAMPASRWLLANRPVGYLFRRAADHFPSLCDGRRPLKESEAKHLLEQYAQSNDAVSVKYCSGKPLFSFRRENGR